MNKIDVVSSGMLSAEMENLLVKCISNGVSVLVSGKTCTGKTVLLNNLLEEMYTKKDTVIFSKGASEFSPEIGVDIVIKDIEDINENVRAIKKTSDLLVVADEYLELLIEDKDINRFEEIQVVGTLEANTCAEAERRIRRLCHNKPRRVYEKLFKFDIIIQVQRLSDGLYRVTDISETEYTISSSTGSVLTQLYTYDKKSNKHESTNMLSQSLANKLI